MFHTGISRGELPIASVMELLVPLRNPSVRNRNAEKTDLLQCKIQLRCVQEGSRRTDLVPFISGLRALDVLDSLLSEPY